MAENQEQGLSNGKCIDCGACGHSGCCSPLDCKMSFKSEYCRHYLNELKFGYEFYEQVFRLLYEQQDTYKELFGEIDEIKETLLDKYKL